MWQRNSSNNKFGQSNFMGGVTRHKYTCIGQLQPQQSKDNSMSILRG